MITADRARETVLRLCESDSEERFAIQSCELSPRGDYWVVRCNSEEYIVHGFFGSCYVGVSAYLVNASSGHVEIVGSGQSWQQYLQDKYDLEVANGAHYIIRPTFDRTDKTAFVNLRKRLERSLQESIRLVSPENNHWLTGRLRPLENARELLKEKGISVDVVLRKDTSGAIEINESDLHWDALKSTIRA
ncbi:hypothetical protein [Xanthomonas sp. SS]|uniref:hypothetical protein n=1 Tax=Xanthomonas sp. SS TaxID=2724122 RepID=UPI00163999CB|nr:hypothetical protein [Xanthomonas sp. SS]